MKRVGIDPIFDEDMIIECLEQPQDEQQHGSGVLMALVNAWDRDLTRDQFIAFASAAITCVDNISRHSMITAVQTFLDGNGYVIRPADIDVTMTKTRQMLERSTGNVKALTTAMSQMATAKDPIN